MAFGNISSMGPASPAQESGCVGPAGGLYIKNTVSITRQRVGAADATLREFDDEAIISEFKSISYQNQELAVYVKALPHLISRTLLLLYNGRRCFFRYFLRRIFLSPSSHFSITGLCWFSSPETIFTNS